jgi:hypothetical protein
MDFVKKMGYECCQYFAVFVKTERSNPGLDAHMYPEPEKLTRTTTL